MPGAGFQPTEGKTMSLSRVRSLIGCLALVAGSTLATAAPRTYDLDAPSDRLQAWRKVQCSTVDGKPVVFRWSGRMYSRIEGERDRVLFELEGFNVRQCGTVTDPQKGTGMKMVSREIMLYLDPATKQVLRRWTNPWSGKEVDVLEVANDPVNMPSLYDARLDLREDAGMYHWLMEVPLYYKNPLAGDYQEQVGNHYHATEMFNFFVRKDDLLDARASEAQQVTVSWVRLGPWLPWMEMGSRPGMVYVNASGHRVKGIEDLPEILRTEIATRHPEYTAPPPLDDARRNETSWTYYKRIMEQRSGAAAPAASR
jgi:hypothetical protein